MNLWKKTLLATAVAAVSTGALAVDMTSSDSEKAFATAEAIKTLDKVYAGKAVATLGAEYKEGDIVTLTYSAPLASDYVAPATLYTSPAQAPSTMQITFGLLSQGESSTTYRVTKVEGAVDPQASTPVSSTVGLRFVGQGIAFDGATVRSQRSVSATYSAETSTGIELDKPLAGQTATVEFLKVIDQYAANVESEFDGVIDVESLRSKFVLPNGQKTTIDTIQIVTKQNDVSLVQPVVTAFDANFNPTANITYLATVDEVQHVIKGDFGFLDSDSTQDGIQLGKNVVTTDGNGTVTVEADKITYKSDANASNTDHLEDLTVTVNVQEPGTVITAQSFKADSSVAYTDKENAESTSNWAGLNAGEWTLNGSSTDITYVPYGGNLEQFIWLTNKGNQTGDISVTAFSEDGTEYGPYQMGQSPAKSVKRLSADIAEKLAADGFTDGRVSMNITVNVPKDDATVYAAYKVTSDADRLTLPTKKLGTSQ